jgi:hypothetical protein
MKGTVADGRPTAYAGSRPPLPQRTSVRDVEIAAIEHPEGRRAVYTKHPRQRASQRQTLAIANNPAQDGTRAAARSHRSGAKGGTTLSSA